MLKSKQKSTQVGNITGGMIMETQDIQNLIKLPVANQAPVARKVMKRGAQLMVVFEGRPTDYDIHSLREASVNIGLALTPSELARMPRLDDFNYVFVGTGADRDCLMKKAVADLAHNGWITDDDGIAETDMVEPRAPRAPIHSTELALAHA